MPTKKHKRKASVQTKPKTQKPVQQGVIASNPQLFFVIGLCLVAVSLYLFAFKAHIDAMFGLAMLSLVAGVALSFFAKISLKKNHQT